MKASFATLLSIACLLTSLPIYGQDSEITGVQFSDDQVQISTEFLDCVSVKNGTAKQYLNITIQNKLESPVQVSFRKELWYDGLCINCENLSDEYLVDVKLEGGETLSSNCEGDKKLKVFFKMLELKNVRQLSHYEFKDIQIEKL